MRTPPILAALAGVALLAGTPGAAVAQAATSQPWMSLRSTTPLPPARTSGRQKVGDAELYYAIYGDGPPVVLLHPGLGHGDDWANQVGPLSQEFQVVVVDLRGHGRSTASATPLSYRLLAEDVVRLIKALRLKKPAVVGWGDGATVGLEMAMRYPNRIGRLVAFGPTYDRTGQREGADRTQTFIDYVHGAADDYRRLAPPSQTFETTLDQMEALWASEPNYTAADLATIKTPTTIMAAEYDEWVRLDHMKEVASLIPNAQMVLVPRASHFAPWQAPKQFSDTLKLLLGN